MGQKTNPTSLRLNKTNRKFESSWYNKFNYSRLLGDEIALKTFIEQVVAQAGLPRNLFSFSPFPKRARALILYLSPDRSRLAKSAKLRLRQSTSLSQKSVATEGRVESASSHLGRGASSTLSNALSNGVNLPVAKMFCKKEGLKFVNVNQPGSNFHVQGKEALEKRVFITWERRLFIHSLLVELVCNPASRSKALSYSDSSCFYKAHSLSWLHGGEQAANFTLRGLPLEKHLSKVGKSK